MAVSKTTKAIRSVAGSGDNLDETVNSENTEDTTDAAKYNVLVIPFSPDMGQYVGLLPEQKVHLYSLMSLFMDLNLNLYPLICDCPIVHIFTLCMSFFLSLFFPEGFEHRQ